MEQMKLAEKITELSLFEGLQREDLVYVYRGLFTQPITDSIIALTENNLDSVGQSTKLKKRVFSIMVECLQNITRHQFIDGREDLRSDQSGMFVICNKDCSYQMTSGNVVNADAIPHLTHLLEKVNSLNKEELKEYYKQVLEDGSISSKGGAGLGLIEMARKSGNKLFYTFDSIDEEISYFYMNTSISHELDEGVIDSVDLQSIVRLHDFLVEKNIMLIFNGGLNQKSLMDMLSLISEQTSVVVERKKKMFNVIVELLQNVVKHGAKLNQDVQGGNPVIFYISQVDDTFVLNAGNYIHKSCIEKLTSRIEYVNSLDTKELDEFYMQSLLNFDIDNSKEAGLGMVDLRIKSGHDIQYEITPVSDEMSFVLMQIII